MVLYLTNSTNRRNIMNEKAKRALDILIEGNKNFVNGKSCANNRDVNALIANKNGQSPIACIVTCSDSRVVPELIFDKGIGDLFVVRGAGAVIGPNILESVEYAVDHLKVPLVVVMSHDDCGVMKAAKSSYPEEPSVFKLLIKSVYEIIDNKTKCYNELARDYTLVKKRKLLKRSEILRKAYAKGELEIVRAYFKFDTGEIVILD